MVICCVIRFLRYDFLHLSFPAFSVLSTEEGAVLRKRFRIISYKIVIGFKKHLNEIISFNILYKIVPIYML